MGDLGFQGFSQDLFQFLDELTLNNNRDWFNENKPRYEAVIREPARAFVRAMEPRLEDISPHFTADDRKVGGSLMRIYRDTRFSKDKTPYKTNVGIQFRHEAGKDVHAPGFYVHLDAETIFIGVGMWRPTGDSLAGVRRKIDEESDRWSNIIGVKSFATTFTQGGESLKRAPKGYSVDHPMIDELKRKDFIASTELAHDDVIGAGFLDLVTDLFTTSTPYMQFLCEAVEQPF